MRTHLNSRMVLFMVILLGTGCAHTQEVKPWIKSGFMPPDASNKFYVGISDPKPTENDARRSAQENAIADLVQREFSVDRNVSVSTVEGASGAFMENRSYVSIDGLNLSDFELIDQSMESFPGPVPQFQCKSLYRFSKAAIAAQKKVIEEQAKKGGQSLEPTKGRELASAVQKGIEERDARAVERLQAVEDWKDAFPRVAFDLGGVFGQYTGFESQFYGAKLGLRLRLWPGFYVGLGGSVSEGSEHYPADSEHLRPTDADGYKEYFASDMSANYRLFGRFYPIYNAWNSLYVDVGFGKEQLVPTCPKKVDGSCLSPSEPRQLTQAISANLGFQLLAPRGGRFDGCSLWLDLGGTYLPDSNLKHGFATSIGVGIPLLRR